MYYTIKYTIILLIGSFLIGSLLLPFLMIAVSLPGGLIASSVKSRALKSLGYILATVPSWFLMLYWTAFVVSFVHRQSARGKGIAFILWIVAFFVSLSPYRYALSNEERPQRENVVFATLELLSFLIIPIGFFVFFFVPTISEQVFFFLPLFDREP